MKPFPQEHELLSLFESEPILLDANVPWTYNHLQFTRTIGESTVECVIEPGYETLQFRWSQRGVEIVALDLHWVAGLTVESDGGREALVAHFRERSGVSKLCIQFSPHIHISWGTTMDLI
jgi:hypothetical protein